MIRPDIHSGQKVHPIQVACKSCRARRVKCDADRGRPCWQCRSRKIACEPTDSKRGKYDRKRAKRGTGPGPAEPESAIGEPPSGGLPATSPSGPPNDSSSAYYTVEIIHRPKDNAIKPLRVHYPIPASIVDHSASAASFGPQTVEQPLPLQDALRFPSPEISGQLVFDFFQIIHIAYPVFDRETFSLAYREGRASPLVLQTIYLLGFTVCSDGLVRQGGFNDRAAARRTHYRRAKTLYDADYDRDPMNIAAVLLLLGFWWAGYDEQKDSCHWVGCATTFAQSRGFHRKQPNLDARTRSIRRRIWWATYIRDRHTSAAFGRPCRIRDEDCDVEFLAQEDFEVDSNYDESLLPQQEEYGVLYVQNMAKLAIIWGDVLTGEFSPRRVKLHKYEAESLNATLLQWESDLPPMLRLASLDGTLGAPFWASMLHFNFRYCQVLLFRPNSIEISTPGEIEKDKRARAAADAITRNAEDLIAANTLRSCQIHLVPALFGALSIHTIVICRGESVQRQLAENKSRQCILALSEISRSWPVKIWMAKSFVSLMTRMTGQAQASSEAAIMNVSATITGTEAIETPGDDPSVSLCHQEGANMDGPHPEAASDQIFHDNFWTSWLDNALDVDMVLRSDTNYL